MSSVLTSESKDSEKYRLRDLDSSHNVKYLKLGDDEYRPLKTFLQKRAKDYHEKNIAKTFVITEGSSVSVCGYVSLGCSLITIDKSHCADIGEYPYSDFPAIKIVRLAVDSRHNNRGLGRILIEWSISIAEKIMPHTGCRFLVVDSKKSAVPFYERCGFTALDTQGNMESDTPLLYIDLHKLISQ